MLNLQTRHNSNSYIVGKIEGVWESMDYFISEEDAKIYLKSLSKLSNYKGNSLLLSIIKDYYPHLENKTSK